MNQEKIGNIIKNIRVQNNLSQREFAEKFGVTYQAVSKWENGKNIPDIAILKEICREYNLDLDNLLDAKVSRVKLNWLKWAIPIFIILVTVFVFLILRNNDFEFKTISTGCDDFTVNGSIAYNNKKSSIYISHITYCGGTDDRQYKNISCVLYETNGKIKTEIGRYNYLDTQTITLEEFLTDASFVVANYIKTCEMYSEDTLHFEIEAIASTGEEVFYKIPLRVEDCE